MRSLRGAQPTAAHYQKILNETLTKREAYRKQRRQDFLTGLGQSIVLLIAIGIVFVCLFLSR